MPNPNLTELVVVLDRSGSMSAIRRAMEDGFDHLVAEQRAAPGECRVTLVQFDSEAIETVYAGRSVADVPPLVLEPRGFTPLLDAVGRTVEQTGQRLSALDEPVRPGKVVVLVITDGAENASREYTRAQVMALVKHQSDVYQWKFVYLGANVDAFAEAGGMGFAAGSAASYTPTATGVGHAYAAMSASLVSYRDGTSDTLSFDDAARQKMNPNAPPPGTTAAPAPPSTSATTSDAQ